MDLEQTAVALRLKNDQLRQDNDQLKSILSVVKENIDLRARMQSFNKDTLEELTGIVVFFATRWWHQC